MARHMPRTLELDEHIDVQRRTWRVQRIGWIVMAVVLGAAAFGAFGGSGPLGTATARDAAGALTVTYARIQRNTEPTEIKLEVGEASTADGEFVIATEAGFDEALAVERVVPPPLRATATRSGTRYLFAAEPGGGASIRLSVKAKSPGLFRPLLRAGEGAPVRLSIAVLP